MGLPVICEQLQAHGRSPDTPVALVERGTQLEQRVLMGTLATMVDVVARAQPRGPTLIIVGDVVRLHEDLSWFGQTRRLVHQRFPTCARHSSAVLAPGHRTSTRPASMSSTSSASFSSTSFASTSFESIFIAAMICWSRSSSSLHHAPARSAVPLPWALRRLFSMFRAFCSCVSRSAIRAFSFSGRSVILRASWPAQPGLSKK